MKKLIALLLFVITINATVQAKDISEYEKLYRELEQVTVYVKEDAKKMWYEFQYSGSLVKFVWWQMRAETGLNPDSLWWACNNYINLHISGSDKFQWRPIYIKHDNETVCWTIWEAAKIRKYEIRRKGLYDAVWHWYVTRKGKMDKKNICAFVKWWGLRKDWTCWFGSDANGWRQRDDMDNYIKIIEQHKNDFIPKI